MQTIEERFWAKINKNGPVPPHLPELGPCWMWTGSVFEKRGGYGQFAVKHGVVVRAHRFSWELHFGPIPEGVWILHRCDVRRCCRPDHLFSGNGQSNSDDMKSKGRERKAIGVENGKSFLDEDTIRLIRHEHEHGLGYKRLSFRFGISPSHAREIVKRHIWNHVN